MHHLPSDLAPVSAAQQRTGAADAPLFQRVRLREGCQEVVGRLLPRADAKVADHLPSVSPLWVHQNERPLLLLCIRLNLLQPLGGGKHDGHKRLVRRVQH